jgi:hypothetical protein
MVYVTGFVQVRCHISARHASSHIDQGAQSGVLGVHVMLLRSGFTYLMPNHKSTAATIRLVQTSGSVQEPCTVFSFLCTKALLKIGIVMSACALLPPTQASRRRKMQHAEKLRPAFQITNRTLLHGVKCGTHRVSAGQRVEGTLEGIGGGTPSLTRTQQAYYTKNTSHGPEDPLT